VDEGAVFHGVRGVPPNLYTMGGNWELCVTTSGTVITQWPPPRG